MTNVKRTKHIEKKYKFVNEKLDSGAIEIKYIKSQKQLADILTKALPYSSFVNCRNGLLSD